MSQRILIEFPDGKRQYVYTNPQTAQYEDYYHDGKFYNIVELKEIK